jgi:hypothetical protein
LVEIPIQVPPEKYRQVLVEFARLGQKGGFVPLYITAPSGFRDHETPRWLIDKGFVAEADSAPRLRALYNQIAIDVAREHGLPLADCASAFQGAREQKLFDHPGEDPIHPNELGYRKIAETLSATLSGLPVAASTGARR